MSEAPITPRKENFSLLPSCSLKSRTELRAVSTRGRIGGRVEIDFAYEIRINDPDRTSGSSLRGKVVDVRYFYAIKKETVLRRASAPDHQVVSESGRRCYTRKRLYDPGYVPVSSGTFLDLFEPDHAQSERTFCRLAER